MKTKSKPRTALRKVTTAQVNHLRAIFSCITADSCTPIGEWTDYACLWNGRKYTMHSRVVTVLWCCADPTKCGTKSGATLEGGGTLADFIAGKAGDSDCAEVMTYGRWRDTGQGCLGGVSDEWVPRGPLPSEIRAKGAKKRPHHGIGGMHHNGRARKA